MKEDQVYRFMRSNDEHRSEAYMGLQCFPVRAVNPTAWTDTVTTSVKRHPKIFSQDITKGSFLSRCLGPFLTSGLEERFSGGLFQAHIGNAGTRAHVREKLV